LKRYPDERLLTVADLAAALMPLSRRSSLSFAEAAIRMVQASPLPHGPLPAVLDSVPPGNSLSPPGGSEPSLPVRAPEPEGIATVNVSGAPLAELPGATDSLGAQSRTSAQSRVSGSPWRWVALAAATAMGVFVVARLASSGSRPDGEVRAPAATTLSPVPVEVSRAAAEPLASPVALPAPAASSTADSPSTREPTSAMAGSASSSRSERPRPRAASADSQKAAPSVAAFPAASSSSPKSQASTPRRMPAASGQVNVEALLDHR
jgi:hypothetical protein